MSRLLKLLEQFDDNVTVGQAISKLKQDEISAKQKETEEIDKVKKDFKDVYLKRIYDCDLFGETLQVFHILEIPGYARDTNCNLYYFVTGSRISFSPQDINFRGLQERTTDTFSEGELRKMKVISREEYGDCCKQYNHIKSILFDLIKS